MRFNLKNYSYSISFVISYMRLLLFVVIFLLKLFFLVLLVVFSEIIVSGATSVTFRNYIDPPPRSQILDPPLFNCYQL